MWKRNEVNFFLSKNFISICRLCIILITENVFRRNYLISQFLLNLVIFYGKKLQIIVDSKPFRKTGGCSQEDNNWLLIYSTVLQEIS